MRECLHCVRLSERTWLQDRVMNNRAGSCRRPGHLRTYHLKVLRIRNLKTIAWLCSNHRISLGHSTPKMQKMRLESFLRRLFLAMATAVRESQS